MADFTVVSEKGGIIMTQEKGLEKMKAKMGSQISILQEAKVQRRQAI